MTQTYKISGPTSFFGSLFRKVVAIAAVIGGLFFLAASAAVAFFLIIGVIMLIAMIVAFLWGKAKITGKPFGPKAYMKSKGFDPDNPFDVEVQHSATQNSATQSETNHGPIIDAHQTPDGWSVDN